MAGYVGYVVALSALFDRLRYHPTTVVGVLLTVPAAVTASYAVLSQFRQISSQEGVERQVQSEAVIVAFLATLLAALTYGLLEAYAHLPHLSMWFVWAFGMAAWGIASAVRRRNYA